MPAVATMTGSHAPPETCTTQTRKCLEQRWSLPQSPLLRHGANMSTGTHRRLVAADPSGQMLQRSNCPQSKVAAQRAPRDPPAGPSWPMEPRADESAARWLRRNKFRHFPRRHSAPSAHGLSSEELHAPPAGTYAHTSPAARLPGGGGRQAREFPQRCAGPTASRQRAPATLCCTQLALWQLWYSAQSKLLRQRTAAGAAGRSSCWCGDDDEAMPLP